jgi:peptide-methionine (R)-S-oxide reductase
MMTRRFLLAGGTVGVVAAYAVSWWSSESHAGAAEETFAVTRSDDDWHKLLTPEQYAVLRQSATERPYTSPLLHEARRGTFACAGCEQELFSSTTKFDSHTGWPSFWAPLAKGVGEQRDMSLGMIRTSVHCGNCGGHLGHVFSDGPQPTGLRYCMNGVAMTFKLESA